ncbi:antibiotic biosynthesis monooxygenase [Salinicola endophyticus]|uniref:Antibiotic biosynthesis monooxygenase n=1 Tax=Salinicola endophyticus TaxID=1949083 RepID=A0AB74U838_9GAMM
MIVNTPAAPYYAVIFTSLMGDDTAGYAAMADKMLTLARAQPGFLGVESARESIGITVSYWTDLDAIRAWKRDIDHREAQRLGRERWYAAYRTRIARVERDYGSAEKGSAEQGLAEKGSAEQGLAGKG